MMFMRKLFRGLHRKPYTALGTIFALHSLAYAIGFLFGDAGFDGEPIYGAVDSLVGAKVFGLIMLLSSLAVIAGFWAKERLLVKFALDSQAVIWLFISWVYVLEGMFIRALGVGLVWVALSCLLKVLYVTRHNDEHS